MADKNCNNCKMFFFCWEQCIVTDTTELTPDDCNASKVAEKTVD